MGVGPLTTPLVVGNHRDAWIVGGGADPNSGSAVLNEAVRAFGEAVRQGWKPLRTIVFASWDGEEYGLIGSTEWVEEYLPWLNHANVAYIVSISPLSSYPTILTAPENTDVSVRGTYLRTSAAPLLDNIIRAATAAVPSPNQTVPGQTVYDLWDKQIKTMGSGSDFTAFQDFAGIPSLDIGFDTAPGEAVYHYHSNYDSFHWMDEFGDPGFAYHRTMAQVVGLLTAQLADLPVISFRAADYARALDGYVGKVEGKLQAALAPAAEIETASLLDDEAYFELRGSTRKSTPPTLTTTSSSPASAESFKLSLKRLHKTIAKLTAHAVELDEQADELSEKLEGHIPWWNWPARLKLGLAIRKVNTKYKYLERGFLFEEGLDGRPWFKHVVFAPGLWTGYAGGKFLSSFLILG